MPHSESTLVNQVQHYRPPCSRCGAGTMLARIQPSCDPGYDLRTFECSACSCTEISKVKYE